MSLTALQPRPLAALPRSLAVLLCAAAALLFAAPSHGHGPGKHDHGHAHGAEGKGALMLQPGDPREPVLGNWQVDVEATLAADPAMKKAAAADGALDAARKLIGQTRLRFTPDGRAVARFPDGRREGVYTVEPNDAGLLIRIVDAHDNRLNTADYQSRLEDGRLVMQHDGAVLVFARPGAETAEKPALPREQAAAIIGRWTVNIPRTLSADRRLATMTAEQQKAARDAAQAFLAKVEFEWRADGTASISMGGQTQSNRWSLVERKGDRYTLDVRFAPAGESGGGRESLILDVDGTFMRMTMGPQVLVLERKN